MSSLKTFASFILNLILSFIGRLIPNRTKRYILLTTIYTKAVNEKIFDEKDLKVLNGKLHLVQDIKAMENISMISDKLWSNVELEKLLRESVQCELNGECISLVDADGLADRVISMTPKWLQYNQAKMRRDLSNLFGLEKFHLATA